MKSYSVYSYLIVFISILTILYYSNRQDAEETITYFPIDASLHFEDAATHLIPRQDGDYRFALSWRVSSALNQKAFLRQDVSLLYKNGRLNGILRDWKQDAARLSQVEKYQEKAASHYQAVTFHYAENHPKETIFTSAQQLSKDGVYLLTKPILQYFRNPGSALQTKRKEEMDMKEKELLDRSLNQGLETYNLRKEQYNILLLTDLPAGKNSWLSAFPRSQREEIIGKLWEGLYKNYVLGIKKEDGTVLDPKGSTIPHLLVAKDASELIVLLRAKDGEPVMLRQRVAR
ncbi:hypothetical protein [Bacillus massiliglaciei]|uniref:hypothetical protein n=1 Tax=Bacillus massiliglaciei TaxID=1816693 RepID=UPI000AF60BA1|nr:hypothetical protein [Bacillus massiliglaciei]